jgi:hypothetical protein
MLPLMPTAAPAARYPCLSAGAEVVRLYEQVLGKAGFRKGMDLYFQRHDGQVSGTAWRYCLAVLPGGTALMILQFPGDICLITRAHGLPRLAYPVSLRILPLLPAPPPPKSAFSPCPARRRSPATTSWPPCLTPTGRTSLTLPSEWGGCRVGFRVHLACCNRGQPACHLVKPCCCDLH